ncbi:MAG: hypothetical protein COA82_03075 [Alkaliphilus sp.]|nr:hypothetical protein [bacterium AH-315-G05]PHS35791.1 MAG: hypothetical protein COA82_03075 [Alkaliphilus sp.]
MSKVMIYSKKILSLSLPSILIIATIAFLYSLFQSKNILVSVFDFNYFFASIILSYGVLRFLFPIKLGNKSKVVDHSNYVSVTKERRDEITNKSMENIFWGISNIIIVSTIELVLYYLGN